MRTLIQGGTVFDGTGSDGMAADVLIDGGTIVAVESGIRAEDAFLINAEGRVVTPGFVDIHRHCDIAPLTWADFGEIELAQGITSTVVGNCGLAPLPSSDGSRAEMYDFLEPVTGEIPADMRFDSYRAYLDALRKKGIPINMGFLAAAGAIKTAVKGFVSSPYTETELQKAAGLVSEAMQEGALGASIGIMYQPEVYSTMDDLAAVIKPAAESGGVLCAHIRGEGDSLVQSVEEALKLAQTAGMPVNISHFKAVGLKNWRDKILRAIDMIEAARAKGQDVTADFYPYNGGSTTIQSLLPPTLLQDGNLAMLKNLETQSGKDRFRQEISREHAGWDNMSKSIGWDRVIISSVSLPEHMEYSGKTVAALADGLGFSDPAGFVADLLLTEGGKVGIIMMSMSWDDIDEIARLPWSFLISDSLYGGGKYPHPRLYGTFPKFLKEYTRDRKILSFSQAIAKMTSMPAARVGLHKRGALKSGFKADIAVFSAEHFTDTATYADPCRMASGMEYVMVNGEIAFQAGTPVNRNKGELSLRQA